MPARGGRRGVAAPQRPCPHIRPTERKSEVRTSSSLTRGRLLAVAVAASAALTLIAATPAVAAHTKGHQQVADTVMGLSGFSSASPPPARTVIQRVSTGPIQVSRINSRTRTPQATSSCTWDPTQTYTENYSAQNTLTEVLVQNSDEPSCTITMSALSEVANIVTPHTGTHNIGNAKCSNCSSLPVYGSYLCSAGLQCAGKWVAEWTVVQADPPGWFFTSWPAGCTPNLLDTVLTCTGSAPETVPPYLPCSPIANSSSLHISSTPPDAASGHGWWLINDCAQTKANVTVQLQEFFSNGVWYDIGSPGSRVVYGGITKSPGTSNQASARVLCSSTGEAAWRSVVTVTLPVQPGHGTYTRPGENIPCSVPYPGAAGSARPATAP